MHLRPNRRHNRSEALALAQGHGDYIWVIDADDMVVGTPDFEGLSADVYSLRYGADFQLLAPATVPRWAAVAVCGRGPRIRCL